MLKSQVLRLQNSPKLDPNLFIPLLNEIKKAHDDFTDVLGLILKKYNQRSEDHPLGNDRENSQTKGNSESSKPESGSVVVSINDRNKKKSA